MAMNLVNLVPVGVAAAAVGLAFMQLRLNEVAQSLRIEMAEKGERLLLDDSLPPRSRASVVFALDHAFVNGWFLVAAAIVALPVLVAISLPHGDLWKDAEERQKLKLSHRAAVNEVTALHMRVTFASHPLLVLLIELEILLFAAPAIILSAVFNGDLLPTVNQTTLWTTMESEAAHIGARRRLAA